MKVVCLDETVSIKVNIETSLHTITFTTFIFQKAMYNSVEHLSFISTNLFADYNCRNVQKYLNLVNGVCEEVNTQIYGRNLRRLTTFYIFISMFSRVTEKELVTDKVYCSNSRWDFTMTPRKLFWYLGQIFFFNTA